jgi:hypothetical protein
MIAGVLCQKKVAVVGVEHWFKFDGNLLNSGSLACTATLASGSVSYSSTGANTGQSITPAGCQITTTPTYALGSNFYIEFYATWTDDSIFNTVISSINGFNIAKTGYGGGKIRIDVAGETTFTSTLAYADGIKHKFKITFIAGEIKLYVDDDLKDTFTSTVTNYTSGLSSIRLLYGVNNGATSGYYDDLIIHRNVIP